MNVCVKVNPKMIQLVVFDLSRLPPEPFQYF